MAAEHLTDAEKAQKLMDLMSKAYAGPYVQGQPKLKQDFLKWGKQLEAKPEKVNEVSLQLRTTLLDMTLVGGVKSLDPSLEDLGDAMMQLAPAKIGQLGGWSTMFYPSK
ncbi:hypothetical protein PQ472_03575 [Lacticaseibacillus pabuli]|uniref:Uncharacterized protein n=1 Tax=Lacticaseibacillus pabuli TaxID=3025672 RepID=A0ABY7WWK3_9LACO|nr:hypothetical protein [Lacticaseibacillus sp. KACC 23028]WDF83332.1 hypothetical protein PQ472_03575 [Lacticaseibacillus sp. KACC 23028]